MSVMELSSQVTFLYFTDMKEAARFFDGVLQLQKEGCPELYPAEPL